MKLSKAFAFTVLAGSVIACSSALAQNSTNAPAPALPTNSPPALPPPHVMPRGPSIEGLARVLNLTEAQKTQVQPIFAEEFKKMRDVRNDPSLSMTDKRVKMKEIRDQTTAQLQPILTPEQFARWQSGMHRPLPRPRPNVSTNTPAGSAP